MSIAVVKTAAVCQSWYLVTFHDFSTEKVQMVARLRFSQRRFKFFLALAGGQII